MIRATIIIEEHYDGKGATVTCQYDGPHELVNMDHPVVELTEAIRSMCENHPDTVVVERGVGSKPSIGSYVGAVRELNSHTTYLYGFGTYEGNFQVGEDDGPQPKGKAAEIVQEKGALIPRIRLDNGQVIWGCECIWGPDQEIKARMKNTTVVRCNISEDRMAATR